MNWSILYRGPLSSCNYACDYCPFAKTKNTKKELEEDAQKLLKFVDWVEGRKEDSIGILFTPWGEGLIRKHYQKAMERLSHMSNVRKVAIQTNLSCDLNWLKKCNGSKIALWTTYHPGEITREQFLNKCNKLNEMNVQYSVGVVGFKESINEIEELRNELSPKVYLWVNAYKKQSDYYNEEEIERLIKVDPLISYNMINHESMGLSCKAGHTTFSVDGDGNITSCHFIKTTLGNIYRPNFEKVLYPRNCSNNTCGCHIGYVHLNKLHLNEVYGEGILERIPSSYYRA
jgi:MoaA/NifB/PqqE/SkfB family radical SAM enzyme